MARYSVALLVMISLVILVSPTAALTPRGLLAVPHPERTTIHHTSRSRHWRFHRQWSGFGLIQHREDPARRS